MFYRCQNKSIDQKQIINYHKKAKHNKDSLLFYIKKAKKLISENTNVADSLKAENDFLYGNYHNLLNNSDSTLYYYNKAISYNNGAITKNTHLYVEDLTDNYYKQSDYLNSLSVLNKYESLLLKSNDSTNDLASVYNKKYKLYYDLKKYDSSLVYNSKAITYTKKEKNKANIINDLIFRSNIYYKIKNEKRAEGLLDSISNINLKESNSFFYLKSYIHYSYGEFYYNDKKYQKAYQNFLKSINYTKQMSNKPDLYMLSFGYEKTATSLVALKQFKLAKSYIDSSQYYKNNITPEIKRATLLNKLEMSFFTNKNFDKVEKEFDSLLNYTLKEEEKRINKDFLALRKSTLKEKKLLIENQAFEIEKIKLKRNLILLLLFLGISLVLGVVFLRQKRMQFTKDKVLLQQRLFRSQMNPHFTSNVLINIQELMDNDKKAANKYLIKFSRLLRLTLENSMQNYIDVTKEIEVLNKYLELQQLRFSETFVFSINTSNFDDLEYYEIPPMLIQPFVENSIKHGFKNIDYLGKIKISLSLNTKYITCIIEDNGIGINKNINFNSSSVSLQLIKDMVYKLTKKDIKINKLKQGTKVEFTIPFKKK